MKSATRHAWVLVRYDGAYVGDQRRFINWHTMNFAMARFFKTRKEASIWRHDLLNRGAYSIRRVELVT